MLEPWLPAPKDETNGIPCALREGRLVASGRDGFGRFLGVCMLKVLPPFLDAVQIPGGS